MSARVLITGATGFAGTHLAEACAAAGDAVTGIARSTGVDLRDARAAGRAIRDADPEVVFHLAALSSVGRSWEEPGEALTANAQITLNVLEAVRTEVPHARVVLVSSGEVYGPPETLPIDERALLAPQNPYAVSKATGDLLGGLYADAHGLRVVRARAFNHAGPGQSPVFVVASLARQVAEGVLAGERPVRVRTGNAEARRDFTDVRDVVRAYRLLAEDASSGVYNVCSERSVSVTELVRLLGESCDVEIDHTIDPALVRAHDVPEVRGSAARLRAATRWEPRIPLAQTLADTVRWWKQAAGREVAPRSE